MKPTKEAMGDAITQLILTARSYTDDQLATAFVDQRAAVVRYCNTRKKWLICREGIWRVDEVGTIKNMVREQLRDLGIGDINRIKAVEEISRSDPRVSVTVDMFDQHPFILATPGEFIDLKTQRRFAPDPLLLISQRTAVRAEAGEPVKFLKLLRDATQGDEEHMGYLLRYWAYNLTGSVREQVMLTALGISGSGKGTLFHTVRRLMGDYATTTDNKVFVLAKNDKHPTGVAKFMGKRMVVGSELPPGVTWDSAQVKLLTGGDAIDARWMGKDYFTYEPSHKFTVLMNDAPQMARGEQGLERRIHVSPFNNKVREDDKDKDLVEVLVEEWPQILNLIISALPNYWQQGLRLPAVMDMATAEYFAALDPFANWFTHKIDASNPQAFTPSFKLYNSWCAFSEEWGEAPGHVHAFGKALGREIKKRAIKARSDTGWWEGQKPRGWYGLELKS